jgi:hypothetical protein
MKRFKPIVIDAKALNRAADEYLKLKKAYFESPMSRYHRLKREAREKAAK